jgi:MoxR-like ATPase
METVISGRPDLVRLTVAVLLAEGHLLLEDVPGVGKTTLAKSLARTVECSVGRIQFTPDLLPSDLTGVTIYRAQQHEFEFRPGPVFANIVIGDEINRASPKTQSALLECMQEAQATIDGTTYSLPRPFLVIATQNPIEMEGTYALPEAQRDRFMARLSVGYPSRESEVEMLDRQESADPLATITPVADVTQVERMIDVTRRLYAAPGIKQYVVDLAEATRSDAMLRLGACGHPAPPRGQGARRHGRPQPRAARRHPGARRPGARPPVAPEHRRAPDRAHRRRQPRGDPGTHQGAGHRACGSTGPPRHRLMDVGHRVRPTPRGLALLGTGLVTGATGLLGGVRVLTQVGGLLVLVVAVSVAWLAVEATQQERGGLRLRRRVTPHPVTVGSTATVEVELASTGGGHRLDRLQISERASRELSGPRPLRARVHRGVDRLSLTYPIEPARRGRWTVGPVEVQRRDLFGAAGWRGPLGESMLVAVRPAVTPLSMTGTSTSTDVDRAAMGSRTPAADDSSLRGYRAGDDLRRVHWRSSARRGELVVRQDEHAGRRPASVLLDLAVEDAATEWSISVAASVAIALLGSGHQVRILGGDVLGAATDHHHGDAHGEGADALLDQMVGLTRPASRAVRESWLLTAVDTLTAEAGGAELVVAVVGALEPRALTALARVGGAGTVWVMVRNGVAGPTVEESRTLDSLRRAGWTACAVTVGEDVSTSWDRLLRSSETLAGLR